MTTTEADDIWVVEYSESQKCFHVETIKEMVDRNIDLMFKSKLVDYVPLMLSPGIHEANQFIEKLKLKMVAIHGEEWRDSR